MNAAKLKLFPTENSVWCLKEDEHCVQELLCLPKNESGRIMKIKEEDYLYKSEMKWDKSWTVSQGRKGVMAENLNDLYYLTENECEKLLYEGTEKYAITVNSPHMLMLQALRRCFAKKIKPGLSV